MDKFICKLLKKKKKKKLNRCNEVSVLLLVEKEVSGSEVSWVYCAGIS